MILGHLAPAALKISRPSFHHISIFQKTKSFSHLPRLRMPNTSTRNVENGKPVSSSSYSKSPPRNKPATEKPSSSTLGFKEMYLGLTPRLRLVFLSLVLLAGTAETVFWFNVLRAKFSGENSGVENYWIIKLWSKISGSKPTDEPEDEDS
jgi:hypothetical protein